MKQKLIFMDFRTELSKWGYNKGNSIDVEILVNEILPTLFSQQERSYSKEEAKKLAFDFYYDMSHKMGVPENLISENATNVDEWIKKFKKK